MGERGVLPNVNTYFPSLVTALAKPFNAGRPAVCIVGAAVGKSGATQRRVLDQWPYSYLTSGQTIRVRFDQWSNDQGPT